MFINTLTAVGKYPVQDCENLQLPIKMELSEKRKSFPEIFVPFLESTSNFKHFERKDDRHSQCVSETTDCVKLGKTTLWKALFQNILWESTCESVPNTYEISMRALLSCFFIIVREIDLEMSQPVWGETLVVFVNKLSADGKYPVQDCENLLLPIEMQLSKKEKSFSQFFVPFLQSTSNFKHFERKDDRHSWCVSEITGCEKLG